jgi:hypothetical protein
LFCFPACLANERASTRTLYVGILTGAEKVNPSPTKEQMTDNPAIFALLCVCSLFVTGVILLGVGLSENSHYSEVPCTLINVTDCIALYRQVDDNDYPYIGQKKKKRDTHIECSGAAFLCDVDYSFANETHVVRGVNTTWSDPRFNCTTVAVNASCVAVVSVNSPANITGVYPPDHTRSQLNVIIGGVILGIFVVGCACAAVCAACDRARKGYSGI